MNVLIIEIGGSHVENMYTLILLLKRKGCNLHIICNAKLVSLLNDTSIVSRITAVPDALTPARQVRSFLLIRRYIRKEKIDAVIIGTTEITVVKNLTFFLPAMNITGIVHNARKLEQSFTFSTIMFRRIRKYLVMGDHLLHQLKAEPKYAVGALNAYFFPPVAQLLVQKPAGQTWVVIPGAVEEKRRDYTGCFDALSRSHIKENLHIILPGYYNEPAQPAIAAAIRRLCQAGCKVTTFDHYLSYDLFHSYVQQSDVLLPLYKTGDDTFYAGARISGTNNLGLAYRIPFLLPDTYSNDDVTPFAISYHDNEALAATILQLAAGNLSLQQITDNYNAARHLDIDVQADKLMRFISTPYGSK